MKIDEINKRENIEKIFNTYFPGFMSYSERMNDSTSKNKKSEISPDHMMTAIIEAYNLGIQDAAKKAQSDLYTKGLYKGAKWRLLKVGDSYDPTENSVMAKTDKKSILKLKIK